MALRGQRVRAVINDGTFDEVERDREPYDCT